MQATQKETDNQVRNAVIRQLEWEPEFEEQDISVGAKDGVVTLTGFVRSYVEKMAAEKAVRSVYGVRAIANDIAVNPGTTRTDPEIARDDLRHAAGRGCAQPVAGLAARRPPGPPR